MVMEAFRLTVSYLSLHNAERREMSPALNLRLMRVFHSLQIEYAQDLAVPIDWLNAFEEPWSERRAKDRYSYKKEMDA